MARRRMTPVVVSSVPPTMSSSTSTPVFVNGADQIGAVVHGDVGLVVQRGVDVLIVGFVVFAFDGIDGDFIVGDKRGGDVILGRERVRGGQHDIGATGLQRSA